MSAAAGPGGNAQTTLTVAQAYEHAAERYRSGDFATAGILYRAILDAVPDHAETLRWLGVVLARQGRLDEAVSCLDRALAVAPDSPGALCDHANVLKLLQRHDEALARYDRALELAPEFIDAHVNRGAVLHDLGRFHEALASHAAALALDKGNARTFCNRGSTLAALAQHDAAVASFTQALAAEPTMIEALAGRGSALSSLGRHEQAIPDFVRILELAPDTDFVPGLLLHARRHCCDWRSFDVDQQRITEGVRAGRSVIPPFPFLDVSDDPAEQLACARTSARRYLPPAPEPFSRRESQEHGRIRIAYLSSDFHEHAVAYLMAGVFEHHDRRRFEVHAIALGSDEPDPMRARLERAFDRFVVAKGMSDRDIAGLLRRTGIDIAIDLNGSTGDGRPGIFALRCAPIQVNLLGFPGTEGAPCIDYLIADARVVPERFRAGYCENIVVMPDVFQANDRTRAIGATPSREHAGLPSGRFVYATFNSLHKLTPTMFDLWMRLLARRPESVLWLLDGTPGTRRNLREAARARGIDPARLAFAPRLVYAAHLGRLRLADLVLDTFPFNGGASASDALWAGVPLLTCAGRAFASRMAASLLHAIGLPELATESLSEYEELAGELAANPPRLTELRARLARNIGTYPLFDTARYARHLEAAYGQMQARQLRGESPAPIVVPSAQGEDGAST